MTKSLTPGQEQGNLSVTRQIFDPMRKPHRFVRPLWHRKERAFSLISVVSMMVLLTLLGAGLLGLASISLRTSTQGRAQAEARANARMALMIALGDLQKALGPDRRASAPAEMLQEGSSEPNLVGAWETWHWDPEGSGSPDYSAKGDGFQKWLVSSAEPADTTEVDFPTGGLDNAVDLIDPSTSGGPDASLRGTLVTVDAGNDLEGRLAYAVMDESLKAPANLSNEEAIGTGQAIARRTAPQRANPGMILQALDPEELEDPRRLITYKTIEVAADQQDVSDYQQQLTCRSLSLLTDPVRGGFKTDLTTVFEENRDISSILGADTPYFTTNEGAPLWDYIRDHYQHYRDVTNSTSGVSQLELTRRELRPGRDGLDHRPSEELLMPVIAKLQIVFSIVTHYSHINPRPGFFNQYGEPKGNQNYGVPHLVYDPVVTIYNPYDIRISLDSLRVRVWDPPVVFGFKKNLDWLRPEFASGDFHGIARFQIRNERNVNARRFFTLVLSQMRGGSRPGDSITLEPGEVRVFSPWVENNWTWGFETRGGYEGRAFFDWDAGKDFGNNDLVRTRNRFGVEAVPGWDPRAGFQTDHLSYGSRPRQTRYQFELNRGWDGGWLGIKLNDTFAVYSKPGRTVRDSRPPDFAVDLLANRQVQPERDILRSYHFRFEDVESELSGGASDPVIEREFLVGDLLQEPNDRSPGGKTPFAILTMSAKTTIDPKDISKPWLHNNPVTSGMELDTSQVGNALDAYDLRFEPMTDFNTFPGVEIDPDTDRGYFGASATANRGVSNVPMYRVPLVPAVSLGDLIPANLVAGSKLPRVTQPLGSSRAHPLIPASGVSHDGPGSTGTMLDHVYLLNDALWDRFFFSTAASFDSELVSGIDRKSLLGEFFAGERKLLNPRLAPLSGGLGDPDDHATELDALGTEEFARSIAGSMAVEGGFNINCADPKVWEAFIGSLRDQAVLGWNLEEHDSDDRTAFPRMSLPLAGDGEDADQGSIDIAGQIRWAGFRTLTDEQVSDLAEAIVEELQQRASADEAPSLSLSEFVNRRIGGPGGLHALAGALDTAIERSGINKDFHDIDSKEIIGAGGGTATELNGLAESAAREGYTGEGAPSMLRQDDLLMALAPVMTVRGDTFRIRAYGESLDAAGDIAARAWCEAVVQRLPSYLDPVDDPFVAEADLKSEINEVFGRRFVIASFRWLAPEEI